ncbi:MAG: hypothetical protein ABMA13_18315 [Chthoniobacteraceae bacterium]
MATNNLDTTLEQEKITSNQLARRCLLNRSTVKSVVMKKRSVAPSTQELMVKNLNRMTKKVYTLADIFPPKLKRLR